MDEIFKELNEQQELAVKQIDGPMLILAGAGSGKTKTITSRLAYLLNNGIPPSQTLTLTFTNKAASEMRERALALLEDISYPPLLCTFHKFGLLFLKFNIEKLNRSNSFVVIDTDDKKRILKSFSGDQNVSMTASEISRYKNSLIDPQTAATKAEQKSYKIIASLYERYEEYLLQNNLVDFDDLLTLTYKILELFPQTAQEISQRYRYIMVDEYQDTNKIQHMLLKKLCSCHENICVVGDDDQSIYGWRGANIKNILEFQNEFNDVNIIKLEKNYRSTNQILKVANDLIDHNRERIGKTLITTKGDGKEVTLLEFFDESKESEAIAKNIKALIQEGINPKNIAILYRINALSRSIEEGLNKQGISYKLVGGIKFYERSEIKDLISYLRIIANPNDDFSAKRVINRPKRGLGKVTLTKIEKIAYENKCSIYEIITNHKEILSQTVSKKTYEAIGDFVKSIEELKSIEMISQVDLASKLETHFKLKEHYSLVPDAIDKIANIDEFYGLLRDFSKQNPTYSIDDFLNELALQSDQDSFHLRNRTLPH